GLGDARRPRRRDAARPPRDGALRHGLPAGHRRLLARRGGPVDRERRDRAPGGGGDDRGGPRRDARRHRCRRRGPRLVRGHRLALAPRRRNGGRGGVGGVAQPAVMLGLRLPDVDRWSERVIVALGQNPGAFTGPGTNTYLVGTGRERLLLDTGQGLPAYLPVLERAPDLAGGVRLRELVLTHSHPDHLGGVRGIRERHGPLRVSTRRWAARSRRSTTAR